MKNPRIPYRVSYSVDEPSYRASRLVLDRTLAQSSSSRWCYHTIIPLTHQLPTSRDLAHMRAVTALAIDPRKCVFATVTSDTQSKPSRSGTARRPAGASR